MKWMLFAVVSALTPGGPSAPDSAPQCALHVWPAFATRATTGGWASNLGIAGAVADYEQNKDQNLRDQGALIAALTPIVQAQALAEASLPSLLDMPGASLVIEGHPPDRNAAAGSRRSASRAPCYAELIVTLNAYNKSAVHGRVLASSFAFHDFRSGKPAKPVTGRASHALKRFPPASAADEEAARRDLASAFAANVRQFTEKLRRRESAGE